MLNRHVLEPGLGPGQVARYILEHVPSITYEGLNVHKMVLAGAKKPIGPFMERAPLTKADLMN